MILHTVRAGALFLSVIAYHGIAAQSPRFDAEIRWTSFGIPHVKANDWGSLGYGFAYATARDAVCTMARDVVMVNGELSRHFGAANGNQESDIFHRAVLDSAAVHNFTRGQSDKSNQFAEGYVAGYNRYLRDHAAELPTSCRGAAWVQPVSADDVTRLTIGVGIRYGLGRYQAEIANAAPPGAGTRSMSTDFEMPTGEGSNAVAMGKAVTASGRGLLLGNPHYPWQGSSRFHLIHTTIPGELDVMGVSLYTTSRVAIGFNHDVAWTHTVSTGMRSTLYALDLNPDDPTQYRYGTEWRPMTRVSVAVPTQDGGRTSRTVYFSHYGPIVVSDQLPWSATRAFALRDVNIANDRSAATYDALNRARSIDEVEAALHLQGVSWTNTIAADRHGTAYYADISVVPNVDAALIERCRVRATGVPASVVVLNGAEPSCEWKHDERSAIAGAMPAESMPRLRRDDVVSNANDSYWLSNPDEPLEGFSPIIGAERTARSLRTRAGLTFIKEELSKGVKATPQTLQDMLMSHRNYGAELFFDDVMSLCETPVEPVVLSGASVDITPACAALRRWDRTENVSSRGAQVWREMWRVSARTPGLYRVPFSVADPVGTPHGIAVEQPAVREAVRRALAQAQQRLQEAGIAPNATLGSVQYFEDKGERIPIPGGDGGTGMWSVISAQLRPGGYTPILAGNSYIQVVGWTADGQVDPRGILTYSQSDDPDSPHFSDQTRLYSAGQFFRLPFHEAEIQADEKLITLRIRE